MGRMFYWNKFNRVEFRRFIKKKLRFTYFFLFMLTRGCIFITREINRVCLRSNLHLFLFTLFLILFLILFIHYKTTFYLYITKPSSTLFEISKLSSIIFKLCIFFTAFYLDSIYFLHIHRPLASYITWYSCSAAASLGINVHYNLRPRTPGSNFDGQNWPVRHSFPQPRRLSDMSNNNLFWFPLFLRQYESLLSIPGSVSPS